MRGNWEEMPSKVQAQKNCIELTERWTGTAHKDRDNAEEKTKDDFNHT